MNQDADKLPWYADDVHEAWKWLSTWISIALGALPQIYDNVPWLQQHLTVGQLHLIVSILAAGGIVNTIRNKDNPQSNQKP